MPVRRTTVMPPHRARARPVSASGAEDQYRNVPLRGLDDTLQGQVANGLEELVVPTGGVETHEAGNRIRGIVAADILEVIWNIAAAGEDTAMKRHGLLVVRIQGNR